jgi:hypothetical protein
MTSPSEATQVRDEAIERVLTNAHEEWKKRFRSIVKHMAALRRPFTSAEVMDKLAEYFPHVKTHELRAAGGLMVRLQKEGVIRPTGRYVPSKRKKSHCRPMREWIGVKREVANGTS